MKKLIPLLLLLSSCNTSPGLGNNIQSDFIPYVNQFEADSMATKGYPTPFAGLTIRFAYPGELTGEIDGQCQYSSWTIAIQSSYWSQMDAIQRKTLIYHELGHCVLGRVHTSATFPIQGAYTPTGGPNTAYSSIMNPYSLVYEPYFTQNETNYLKEYFQTP
jgi:hypothetical protein